MSFQMIRQGYIGCCGTETVGSTVFSSSGSWPPHRSEGRNSRIASHCSPVGDEMNNQMVCGKKLGFCEHENNRGPSENRLVSWSDLDWLQPPNRGIACHVVAITHLLSIITNVSCCNEDKIRL